MLICLGPNAVRILRTIGILDDIMKKINPDEVRNRGFKFYDGLSDSNVPFYEVRVRSHFVMALVLMIYSIQHPPKTKDWEFTGVVIHFRNKCRC